MKEKLYNYIKENYVEEAFGSFRDVFFEYEMAPVRDEDIPKRYSAAKASSISEFINNNKEESSFQTTLFKMIDDRNLIDSDVYNKVHIDRRLFSKIRNEANYHPSKDTVILLGLSLELSESEIESLLDSAAYSLPKNNYYDLIIRFCFKEKIYSVSEVNELLDTYNLRLFNY